MRTWRIPGTQWSAKSHGCPDSAQHRGEATEAASVLTISGEAGAAADAQRAGCSVSFRAASPSTASWQATHRSESFSSSTTRELFFRHTAGVFLAPTKVWRGIASFLGAAWSVQQPKPGQAPGQKSRERPSSTWRIPRMSGEGTRRAESRVEHRHDRSRPHVNYCAGAAQMNTLVNQMSSA